MESHALVPNEQSKGITCGTAVGAKQERAKGNKQEAKYRNLEDRHERSGRKERGKRRAKAKLHTGKTTVR